MGHAWALTRNQANLTIRIFIATGHHGPHCVIHNCNYVQVKLLQRKQLYCRQNVQARQTQEGHINPRWGWGWETQVTVIGLDVGWWSRRVWGNGLGQAWASAPSRTFLLLMASLSMSTMSSSSQSVALKPLVHSMSIPWKKGGEIHLSSSFLEPRAQPQHLIGSYMCVLLTASIYAALTLGPEAIQSMMLGRGLLLSGIIAAIHIPSLVNLCSLALAAQNKGLDHSDPTSNLAKNRLRCD